MLAIPSFLAPPVVGARLLNILLAREEWARQRLSRHSGKTVRFVAGRLILGLTVQSDGYAQASDPAASPDVILTVPVDKLGQLPGALRAGDPETIAALLHVQGDAGLARVVSDLARELRWDIEEDLSAMVGDVAALRLLKGMKSMMGSVQLSAERLADNAGEYLTEESGLVLGRAPYNEWQARLQASHERLDALERRVARLAAGAAPPVGRRT